MGETYERVKIGAVDHSTGKIPEGTTERENDESARFTSSD
jgi:hypothetical protein